MWDRSFCRLVMHIWFHSRSESVHPSIILEEVEEDEEEDDISMPSESIAALIGDSICDDHESDNMDDESIDVVIDDDGEDSVIGEGSTVWH